MNTYVPIPFKEMVEAGAMKQDRYDRSAAAIDATIQRVEALDAVPGSPDELFRKEQVQKMYDIRDKYIDKDLSDSFVVRQMNNDINTGIEKDRIKRMQENAMNYRNSEKMVAEMTAKGLYNPLLHDDSPTLYDSAKGVRSYQPTPYIDKEQMFSPYFEKMGEDFSYVTDENGYATQIYGISDKKVKEQLANAESIVGTPQGQNYVNQYRKLNPGTKLNPVEIIRQDMYNVGSKFAKTEKRILGAALQDGGGASKKSQTFQDIMYNISGGADKVPGKRPGAKLDAIEEQYAANATKLAVIGNPNSPQYNKDEAARLAGENAKVDEARKLGEQYARKENAEKIAIIKAETLSKIKNIPEFSQIPDETINQLIEDQFAEGFTAGAARFGNALHQTGDKVLKGAPVQLVGALLNAAKMQLKLDNPANLVNLRNDIVKTLQDKGDWTFGDLINTTWKKSKELLTENKTNVSSAIQKRRDQDERNIIRDLVKNVNTVEKDIKQTTNDYVLGQLQSIVSQRRMYPIITTPDSGGNEQITTPTGDKIYSSTDALLKGLPITMDGFEIRQKDKSGKYQVLNEDEKKVAKVVTATWKKNAGSFINANTDEQGNTILTVAYVSPKENGSQELKEYEIKLPYNSDEAKRVALDFTNTQTQEGGKIAMRLLNHKLNSEIYNYINTEGGHDYKIYTGKDSFINVNVKRSGGKYIISGNGETGEVENEEQVRDTLHALQYAASQGGE